MITDYQKADLLMRFINSAKEGMVKPNDATQAIRKLDQLKKNNVDIGAALDCCTDSNIVRDAIEFKPYIIAATNKLFNILEVDVKNG